MPFEFFSVVSRVLAQARKFWRGLAVIAVAALLITLAWAWGNHKLEALWTAVGPGDSSRHYTELAFAHPNDLPEAVPKDGRVEVAFTVHNAEGRTVSYACEVVVEDAGGAQATQLEPIILQDGATASKTMRLTVRPSGERRRVSVVLPAQKQAISFWLEGAAQ